MRHTEDDSSYRSEKEAAVIPSLRPSYLATETQVQSTSGRRESGKSWKRLGISDGGPCWELIISPLGHLDVLVLWLLPRHEYTHLSPWSFALTYPRPPLAG